MTLLLTDDERKHEGETIRDDGKSIASPPALGAWETTTENVTRRIGVGPITFDEFVRLPEDANDKAKHIELIDGVLTERMAAQLNHEILLAWLTWQIKGYADARDLGVVLGSRTAVRISEFGGRLPDLLFVRTDRVIEIARQRGLYGPPDLIIELASPNDFAPQLLALEADYRTLGVSEIVIINQKYQTVRVVRRGADTATNDVADIAPYNEQNLNLADDAEVILTLETVPGFSVALADLFADPRPKPATLLARLLADNPTA